jgi:hypothetical protein
LGDERFKRQIAKALGRRVAPRPQGRPRKPAKYWNGDTCSRPARTLRLVSRDISGGKPRRAIKSVPGVAAP